MGWLKAVLPLILMLVSQFTVYNAYGLRTQVTVGECTLHVAAVSTSGTGVISNLSVKVVYPGSGRVYISTSPATEIDTQGAARIAAFTATLLLGLDFNKYDFYYQLESPSIIVGGPSAGSSMAIATLAALSGVGCNTRNVATGMVYIDSTIGPVGGLEEKLKAVADSGGKVFVVPKGQLTYTSYQRVVERIGPFAIVRSIPVQVNLSEVGGKLGVRVVEAGNVVDAMKSLLGTIPRLEYSTGGLPQAPGLDDAFKKLDDMYRSLESKVPAGDQYRDFINEAKKHRDAAVKLAGEGRYYPAIKELSTAAGLLQAAIWLKNALENNLNVSSERIEAEKVINETTSIVYGKATEATGLASIYLWIAASEYQRAVKGLKDGYRLPEVLTISGRAVDTRPLTLLASAYWDAIRAKLISQLDWDQLDNMNDKARIATSLGKSITAYATTLLQESGAGASDTVNIAAEMVVSADVEEYKHVAAYLSMAGAALASSAIHSIFDKDQLLSDAEKLAYRLGSAAGSMAAAALLQNYEYYKSIGDLEAAWANLDLAILVSWLSLKHYNTVKPTETTTIGGVHEAIQTTTVTMTVTETTTRIEANTGVLSVSESSIISGLLLGVAIGVFIGIILVYRRT